MTPILSTMKVSWVFGLVASEERLHAPPFPCSLGLPGVDVVVVLGVVTPRLAGRQAIDNDADDTSADLLEHCLRTDQALALRHTGARDEQHAIDLGAERQTVGNRQHWRRVDQHEVGPLPRLLQQRSTAARRDAV